MITFKDLDLFSSGPSSIDPGTIESRDAVANVPGSIGATILTQGTQPRQLLQRGTLVADDALALQALVDSIQVHVGTNTATLVDQQGKAWPECYMQRINVQQFTRLGPRMSATYEITYLQTNP